MATIYDDIGVRPVINAAGTLTRLGGSIMPLEVVQAMARAAEACVRMEDLQERAGAILAEATGTEAGYVTCGAAAGLMLGAAACMAGLDIHKM
jgi:L-seryl-tRNA(Ser) seleniumtransferase